MNAVAEKQEEKTRGPETIAAARDFVTPAVNIVETTDAYILEAEMPGVAKDGLTINVEGEVLTLEGRRPSVPEGSLLYGESRAVGFRRVFELDPSVDTTKIAARVEQGVLTLTLPKAEKAKPRRITVN